MKKITRKKNSWIIWDDRYGWPANTCSNCGYTEHHDIHISVDWNYCPKCKVKLNGFKNGHCIFGIKNEIMDDQEKYRD